MDGHFTVSEWAAVIWESDHMQSIRRIRAAGLRDLLKDAGRVQQISCGVGSSSFLAVTYSDSRTEFYFCCHPPTCKSLKFVKCGKFGCDVTTTRVAITLKYRSFSSLHIRGEK